MSGKPTRLRWHRTGAACAAFTIFTVGMLIGPARSASAQPAEKNPPAAASQQITLNRMSLSDQAAPEKSQFCSKDHIFGRIGSDRSGRRSTLPGVATSEPLYAWMLVLSIQNRTGTERQFVAEFYSHLKVELSELMRQFEGVVGPAPTGYRVTDLVMTQCEPIGDPRSKTLPVYERLSEIRTQLSFTGMQRVVSFKFLMYHYNVKEGMIVAKDGGAAKDGAAKDGGIAKDGAPPPPKDRTGDVAEPGMPPACKDGDVICERMRDREEDVAMGPRGPRVAIPRPMIPPPYVSPPERDYPVPDYPLLKASAPVRSGNTVVVLENAKCSKEGNFLLAYRGRALSAATDNVDVLVEKRFGLNNYVKEPGPGGEKVSDKGYLCAPRREICYGEVDFNSWDGQVSRQSVISFPRADLIVQEKESDNDDLVSIFKHFLTTKCGKPAEPAAAAK
jgi:hypothetical protein